MSLKKTTFYIEVNLLKWWILFCINSDYLIELWLSTVLLHKNMSNEDYIFSDKLDMKLNTSANAINSFDFVNMNIWLFEFHIKNQFLIKFDSKIELIMYLRIDEMWQKTLSNTHFKQDNINIFCMNSMSDKILTCINFNVSNNWFFNHWTMKTVFA